MAGFFEGINKRLKFKGIITVIVLVVLGGLLIGCGEKKTGSTAQEIGEKFLKQLFTADCEKRYTEFLDDEDIDKYYDTFSDYTSQECLDNLKQNRIPMKYDKTAKEEIVFVDVSDIKLEFDETGLGTFEVLLEERENSAIVQKATGQITVEGGKKGNEVTSFFLSNIVQVENDA